MWIRMLLSRGQWVDALKERAQFGNLLRVISFSFGKTSHGLSLVVPSNDSDFDNRLIYLISARHMASRRVVCFRRGLLYILDGCVTKICQCTSVHVAAPSLGFAWAHVNTPSRSPAPWLGEDMELDSEKESQIGRARWPTLDWSLLNYHLYFT